MVSATALRTNAPAGVCIHHWLVESEPRAGEYHGECIFCRARRTFAVHLDYEPAVGTGMEYRVLSYVVGRKLA